MASVEQWAKWREDYLSGLKAIVDNAPYEFAEFSANIEFGYFDIEKAKAFVDEAIRLGLISTNDSDYFQKAIFFAETPSAEKYYGESYSLQETLELYKEAKSEIEGMDNYAPLVYFGLILPLEKACYYVFCNHPVPMKVALAKLITATGVNIKCDAFRLGLKELFTFLQGMTPYGLNGLLTDIKCSANYSDDLFEAIQNGDFDSFKALCRDGEIDLTEIAEIAGYLEAVYGKITEIVDSYIKNSTKDEETVYGKKLEVEESIDSSFEDGYLRPLLTMMGLPADSTIRELSSLNLGQEIIGELWPNNADEDFAQFITLQGITLANLYHYIGFFCDEELNEVNRILSNPLFEPLSKVAQLYFAMLFEHLPYAVKICFTQDEQNEIATLFFNNKESGDTDQKSQVDNSDNQPEQNDQEQVQPIDVAPEVTETKVQTEVGLHWPTDEELEGYKDNYNGKEYFTDTIFGPAGKVKASVIKELYDVLSEEGILKEDIETQLIFLARYTGKEIPGITLRPIEWHMLNDDREGAIGYLIYMTTTTHEFVKGESFFYFDFNGDRKVPDNRLISSGGHRWANQSEQKTAKIRFKTALNEFLKKYKDKGEE